MSLAPVRLCCGARHFGPVCADNHIMCCLCFERFPVVPTTTEDVCPQCEAGEQTT